MFMYTCMQVYIYRCVYIYIYIYIYLCVCVELPLHLFHCLCICAVTLQFISFQFISFRSNTLVKALSIRVVCQPDKSRDYWIGDTPPYQILTAAL